MDIERSAIWKQSEYRNAVPIGFRRGNTLGFIAV